MSFIQMSLAGATMIVAAAIIRAFFMYRIPKKVFIVIWGVVIFRLLLPFDIPASTSIFAIMQSIQGPPTIKFSMEFKPISPGVMVNSDGLHNWHYAHAAIERLYPTVPELAELSISPFTIVWLVGTALFSILFIAMYIMHYRRFLTSLPIENEFIVNWQQEHKLRRKVRVRVSDRIATPLTYGIISPVILLPKNMNWEDEEGLNHILTHEFIHIKHFDGLRKLIMAAVVCMHWFNPLVWAMYLLFNRDLELSCDEGVIKMLGEESKSCYALTLIGAQEKRQLYPPLYNAFGRYAIEERIKAIIKTRRVSIIGLSLVLLLAMGTTMVFATSAEPAISYNMSARMIVLSEPDDPCDEWFAAYDAAVGARVAFSRFFPAFAREWDNWENIMFIMNFIEAENNVPAWHGLVIVDMDSDTGHDFPFTFTINAETGQIIMMSYAPRTRYLLEVNNAHAVSEEAVMAIYYRWNETYSDLRAGRYDDRFIDLARRAVKEIRFTDSEVVSMEMQGYGAVASGPTGTVIVRYANGDSVELQFLMRERHLVSVQYIRSGG